MTQILMLKAFMRAFILTLLAVVFIVVLWHYTLITITLLAISWFSLMLQLDPPEHWDY
jgi:uncharacterized membrane protein